MQITTFLELAQVGVTRKSSCLFSPSSPHSPQKSAFWPRKSPIFELPDLEPFFTEPAEKARVYAGLWCFQNLPLLLLIFHQIPYAFFDSKCGRSASNRRKSSNLFISAIRNYLSYKNSLPNRRAVFVSGPGKPKAAPHNC